MSITDYSSLQSSIASWIARSDLTSVIPDFITLFEADVNRGLRVRQMMVTQSTTPSSGRFGLPSDYLSWVRVTWKGTQNIDLEYVHPSYLQSHFPDTPTSQPCIFTVEGSTDNNGLVRTMPIDASPIDFVYYQKITALSTSNTSNWLLAAHPDLYLAGALVRANVFAKDYDTAAVWKATQDGLFDAITKLDQKTRGPSAIRVPGRNP
jgi:hypothetical protein